MSVLRNLSAREITKFARVCRSWNHYGRTVLNGRNRMCANFIVAENTCTAMAEMREYMEKLPVIPRVALFSKGGQGSGWTMATDFQNMLLDWRKRLHPGCLFWAVDDLRSGLVSTLDHTFAQFPRCLSTFVFPTLPEGAHLISFNLTYDRYRQLQGSQLNRAAMNDLFAIPEQLPVRCLLMFSPALDVDSLCRAFWNRDSGQIAVCGATVFDNCSIEPGSDVVSHINMFGLAFCGHNVCASSVVIGASEDPSAKLRLLKEHINSLEVPPKQIFAFQFVSCDVARAKFELRCQGFREMFSQAPLANIRAYRNYGRDYSPTRPAPTQPSNWRLPTICSLFALVAIT